jgi:hypothetical protein
MKAKNLFLIIGLLVSMVSCKTTYNPGDKTEYFFSEEVNKAINANLLSYQKYPEYKFYILIGGVRYTENCDNYQLLIGTYKDTPGEAARRFIEHSNHYFKSNDLIVPVIFDYDYSFAFFGKDERGRVIRKNVTGNSYLIEFDRAGKVIREGF